MSQIMYQDQNQKEPELEQEPGFELDPELEIDQESEPESCISLDGEVPRLNFAGFKMFGQVKMQTSNLEMV